MGLFQWKLKRLMPPRNLNSVSDLQRNADALAAILPLLREVIADPLNLGNINKLRLKLEALGVL